MSDRPDKEQMMRIVMPALAIAAVIVLIGLLIANRDNPDTSGPGGAKKVNFDPKTNLPEGLKPEEVNADGLTLDKPSDTAPEWKVAPDPADAGLKFWDVKEGSGLPAQAGATVTIHYTGWTLDGKIFDSSVKRNEPTTFPLGDLIPGWQKGIPGMKPGGVRRLYIPWPMAYGEQGRPPSIPPKADLIFEIKLFAAK
jgi:hypothetical protein